MGVAGVTLATPAGHLLAIMDHSRQQAEAV